MQDLSHCVAPDHTVHPAHDPDNWGASLTDPKEGIGDCRRAVVGVVVDDAAPRGVIYRSTHFLADLPL